MSALGGARGAWVLPPASLLIFDRQLRFNLCSLQHTVNFLAGPLSGSAFFCKFFWNIPELSDNILDLVQTRRESNRNTESLPCITPMKATAILTLGLMAAVFSPQFSRGQTAFGIVESNSQSILYWKTPTSGTNAILLSANE